MVFSSLQFIFLFLPAMLLVYYLLPRGARNGWLFVSSILFYAYGATEQPLYILLLLASIGVNFLLGRLIARSDRHSRALLAAGLIYNLGWLFLFKYADFFARNLNALLGTFLPDGGVSIPLLRLTLPLGISFYTFQVIAYLADVYHKRCAPEASLLRFGTYVAMFPKLTSGPITSYSAIAPALKQRRCSWERIDKGLRLFTIGLGMKVLLANQLGNLWNDVNTIGFESISTPLAWMGVIGFSLQLYFDFWGYSLMAIGLGHLLGFKLPQNFDHPYLSKSMTEFWRRWHMTLGAWFRDYVYIPLGGNRRGTGRMVCNLLVVWLLTGFWHGADWNFLLWGLVLFALIVLEKFWLKSHLDRHPVLGHTYMILMIPLSWLIFAVSDVGKIGIYLTRLFPFFGAGINVYAGDYLKYGATYGVLLVVGILMCTRLPEKLYCRFRHCIATSFLLIAVFWLSIYCLYIGLNDPFLYFRF